jgi:hypothetical protein
MPSPSLTTRRRRARRRRGGRAEKAARKPSRTEGEGGVHRQRYVREGHKLVALAERDELVSRGDEQEASSRR